MDGLIDSLLAAKGVAVALWFGALFAAERWWPAAPRSPGWLGDTPRLGRNAGLWLLNSALSLAVVVPASAWAAGLDIGIRPAGLTGAAGLVADLLLLDFLIYWWHRANHRVPLLWRFHEVHHLDRTLDTTSAVRFHFGEVLLSAGARALVIVLFAIPLGSVLAFEALVLGAALFHHSNVRLPGRFERALAHLVVTPSIHWVHHHAVRADTDSNYATVLSLWDRLFGSRSRTARRLEMAIGTEGRAELPLAGLLASPFRRRPAVIASGSPDASEPASRRGT